MYIRGQNSDFPIDFAGRHYSSLVALADLEKAVKLDVMFHFGSIMSVFGQKFSHMSC